MVKNKTKVYINKKNGKILDRGKSLTSLYNEIRNKETLSKEDINELFSKYKCGDAISRKMAFDKICEHNMKLVVSIAKKYCLSPDNLNDLIQEGSIGLMKAIDCYDVNNGAPFHAYAIYWIRREINLFQTNKRQVITQTNRSKTSIFAPEIRDNLTQKLERNPTEEEVFYEYNSKHPDKKINDKDDFVDIEYFYIDIDKTEDSENKVKNLDFEYNNKTASYNDYLYETDKEWDKSLVDKLLNSLKTKKKNVIKLYYVLNRLQKLNTKTISMEMNMTESTINNIRKKAIEKMKNENKKLSKSFIH